MKCGLLGRKLGHSYSPQIHACLGDYSYTLFEKEPEEVEDFLKSGDFTGLNVTIPYKKAVIPYLAELSPNAKKLGAVNTIVRRADGTLFGHNTDYFGFASLLKRSGLSVAGKTVSYTHLWAAAVLPIPSRLFWLNWALRLWSFPVPGKTITGTYSATRTPPPSSTRPPSACIPTPAFPLWI